MARNAGPPYAHFNGGCDEQSQRRIAEKIYKIVHPPTRPSIYANDEKLREAVNPAFAVTAPEDPQMWEDVT